MDGYRVFTWDPDNFPDPAGLCERLTELGVRVTAIVDCAIKSDEPGRYRVYDEAAERGYLLRTESGAEFSAHVWPGAATLPDFARHDVREWWGSWHRILTDVGIEGVLNDMNEPALRDRPFDDPEARRLEVPETIEHGAIDERTIHAEVHNVYGSLQVSACADGLAAARPDHRNLVLTRAGFAGVQRHAGIWTGDNFSSWEHLEMSLPQLINLGLSGIAFCGADIGGFFGHCTAELMIRWMQLGAFSPLMRANNAKGCSPQEPWVWGPDVETSIRSAIELRYRLLPYLYSALAESHRNGAPVLRPIWWFEPRNVAHRMIADQALVGDSLLIAPVVRPGQDHRAVQLPTGRWFDWRTGQASAGDRTIVASATLHEPCPIFVREGTVLPQGPVVQYADQAPTQPMELHVFPDEQRNASGSLYEDDGITLAHERGSFRVARFRFSQGELSIDYEGARMPPLRFTVVVHEDSD
jgi:alpha-glucosidase